MASDYPESKADKTWERGDLTCSIVRHSSLGHLCGYVRFPKRPVREESYSGILAYVPVHGGITYARKSEDGGIVYGFDCGHSGDAPPPEFQKYEWDKDGHVWTENEVIAETERMADAIKAIVPYEERYLLARDSTEKATVLDEYHAEMRKRGIDFDLSDNFRAMLAALSGAL